MAKTVDRPMYEQFQDTPWITHNREMENTAYGTLNNALDNLYNFNENQYQAIADAYTGAQWKDLNRGYLQAMNQQAANERNRLGTSGASSSLYNTNTLQNSYNDLAGRLASNTASQYNNLINQEWNRRLQNLNLYNNLWRNAGTTAHNIDLANWDIRNQNKDRQWANDVDEHNNTGWNAIANVLQGSVEGAQAGSSFGPWGAAIGGVVGGLGATGTNQNSSNLGSTAMNLFSNLSGNSSNNYSNYANNQNWLANSGIGNYGLSTNNLTDTLSNSNLYQAMVNRGLI